MMGVAMWPPPSNKPYSRVTSDGTLIVDQEVLLSDPKVQAEIEKIGRILKGRVIGVDLPPREKKYSTR